MKKLLSLIMAMVLCLSICACGAESNDGGNADDSVISGDAQDTTPTEPEGPTATPVNIGDTIDLDYATVTLDDYVVTTGYQFEHTDTSSGIKVTRKTGFDCSSGMKIICLTGKFTNKSKAEVYSSNNPIYGKIIINGYEYETRMRCYIVEEAESVSGVAPLREVDYFLCAEVPESLVGQIDTCQFYIGFVKDLDPSVWASDLSDYDALYLLEATPAEAAA